MREATSCRALASRLGGNGDAGTEYGAVVMHVDITERKLGEQELDRLAYEDALATIAENLEILEAIRAELEVVEERAEGGLVDVRELLRAQDQFRNAEQRLLDLRFDAYAAEIELRAHLDRLPLPEVDPEKTAGGAEGTEGRGEGGADPGDPEDVEGEEEDVGRGDDR